MTKARAAVLAGCLSVALVAHVSTQVPGAGGSIAGRVVGASGEPMSDLRVYLVHQFHSGSPGPHPWTPVGPAELTNSRGEFRFDRLGADTYYVFVTTLSARLTTMTVPRQLGYIATYYPDSTTLANARGIELAAGESRLDVAVALVRANSFRVSGSAIRGNGQPFADGSITLQPRGGPTVTIGASFVQPDGRFLVTGVGPGEYTIRAMTRAPIRIPAGWRPEQVETTITVQNGDVSGVHLALPHLIAANGRVRMETTNGALPRPGAVRVTLHHPTGAYTFAAPLPSVAVNDDYTFHIETPPLTMRVLVMPPPPWNVKTITLAGVDVTTSGIDFTVDHDIDDIEIVLTDVQ